MPHTKTRASKAVKKAPRAKPSANGTPLPDVLTLAEAAAYLRLPIEELLRLVGSDGLPGRQCAGDWWFLKSALQNWLSMPNADVHNERLWLQQFGALKDDPYLEEMLADIYKRRGRPETEEV